MEKVQKREGLICVCAECKKVIRTIGVVTMGVRPLISHGICPACADRLYGEIFKATAEGKPADRGRPNS
jgi:hypothetical protein